MGCIGGQWGQRLCGVFVGSSVLIREVFTSLIRTERTCMRTSTRAEVSMQGGQSVGIAKKPKKKKKAKLTDAGEAQEGEQPAAPGDSSEPSAQQQMGKAGDLYEKEFNFETERATQGKTRNTPWGQGYRAPPEVLHGYHAPVTCLLYTSPSPRD